MNAAMLNYRASFGPASSGMCDTLSISFKDME